MINVPTLASLRRAQSGFTLIEVLVASFVLMVGAMSAFALIDRANGATNRVRTSDNATNLARELIEGARSVPYEKVSSPGVIAELQALPGLQDIDGGAYTIRRNGTTYSVSVDVCIMDDPKDGGGPRPTTATFCANSAPTGTADKNPEDYKRVTVSVSWTEQGRTRVSKQTGLINNPGSASGPAIRSLTPVGYTAPFVVTTDVNAVTWDVTTSSKPATIGWLLDGTRQTGAVTQNGPTGLAWRFDWNMKTLDDGAYVVAAEASDVYGVSGPGRQETDHRSTASSRARPSRSPAAAPGSAPSRSSGRRTPSATSSATRSSASGPRRPSARSRPRSSTPSAPTRARRPTPTLEYYVRAYDKDTSGNLRASADSTHLLVTKDNTAPYKVTGLTLQTLASGDTKLTWSRAVPEDPDAGDSVSFFRDLPRRDRAGRPLRALLRRQRQPVRHLDRHRHRRHPAQLLGHRGRPAVPRVAVRRAGDRMTRRARDEAGFTVIELAVAAAISLVVLGATMSLLISMMTQRTATEGHADAAQQARQGIDRLSRQLRNLASPADVITNSALIKPKSVDRNLPFDLVFKDVDEGALTSASNPANVRRVRYCLQTSGSIPGGGVATTARGVLWVQTQRTSAGMPILPAAPPPAGSCPGPGWDDQRRVADYLVNAQRLAARSALPLLERLRRDHRHRRRRARADHPGRGRPARRPRSREAPARGAASRARSSCATRTARRAPSSATSSRTRSPARCSSTAPAPRTPRTSG